MAHIVINEDYVDQLIKNLREWRTKADSMVFAQFLDAQQLGWSLFKRIKETYPEVRHEFEIACASMVHRWVDAALASPKMSSAMEKVMLRYLRFYDLQTWEMELDARRSDEAARGEAIAKFVAENYEEAQLDEPYNTKYASQEQKRPRT